MVDKKVCFSKGVWFSVVMPLLFSCRYSLFTQALLLSPVGKHFLSCFCLGDIHTGNQKQLCSSKWNKDVDFPDTPVGVNTVLFIYH